MVDGDNLSDAESVEGRTIFQDQWLIHHYHIYTCVRRLYNEKIEHLCEVKTKTRTEGKQNDLRGI